eukprot:m.87126 g.87126  ORF g.87126 m.87126 type:complete len:305 (-) comp50958_c0_seq5:100-1014(-)
MSIFLSIDRSIYLSLDLFMHYPSIFSIFVDGSMNRSLHLSLSISLSLYLSHSLFLTLPSFLLISLKFAPELYDEAERFKTNVIKMPYLGVHLRRSDFLYAHKDTLVSIEHAAQQMSALAKENEVKAVFLATDAREDDSEYRQLSKAKLRFFRYPGGKGIENEFKKQPLFSEGQRAIIDQIICASADVFLGTAESTFTYRITEERFALSFARMLLTSLIFFSLETRFLFRSSHQLRSSSHQFRSSCRDLLRKSSETTYNTFCPQTTKDGVLGFHCHKPTPRPFDPDMFVGEESAQPLLLDHKEEL